MLAFKRGRTYSISIKDFTTHMTVKNRSYQFLKLACYTLCAGLLFSCGSSKKINTDYLYFQNGAGIVNVQQNETTVQPNDLLGIQVFSKTSNQEQVAVFNNAASSGYQVTAAGTIDMPQIGSMVVTGLTKNELQNLLVQKLTNFVKNPAVIVRFLQFNINMLGEVRAPGTLKLTMDRVTIIDAISAAGDLSDFARRDNITVIREENGKKIFHQVDLRSKTVFQSPVYVLQPNDIVYVQPNNNKLRTLNVDQESQRRLNLLLSLTGFILGLTTFVISIIN